MTHLATGHPTENKRPAPIGTLNPRHCRAILTSSRRIWFAAERHYPNPTRFMHKPAATPAEPDSASKQVGAPSAIGIPPQGTQSRRPMTPCLLAPKILRKTASNQMIPQPLSEIGFVCPKIVSNHHMCQKTYKIAPKSITLRNSNRAPLPSPHTPRRATVLHGPHLRPYIPRRIMTA
jgi:hypothetical protein